MTRQRLSIVAAAAIVALAVGGGVLAARAGDRDVRAAAPTASAPPPVRVVLPGKPGEPGTVTDSDHVRAPDGSTYNGIDTAFVRMMIAHHGQAIAMADLAPERAADAGVRALAARISAAQRPEIDVLRAWLQSRELPETDPAHDHSTMPGMQTDADLAALAAARDADFDRRFVTMMTAHHEGAVQMAGDLLAGGTDQTLSELANEMAVEQSAEIQRMRRLGLG